MSYSVFFVVFVRQYSKIADNQNTGFIIQSKVQFSMEIISQPNKLA